MLEAERLLLDAALTSAEGGGIAVVALVALEAGAGTCRGNVGGIRITSFFVVAPVSCIAPLCVMLLSPPADVLYEPMGRDMPVPMKAAPAEGRSPG